MLRSNAMLVVTAIVYPVVSFMLMLFASGNQAIPSTGDWVLLSIIVPASMILAAMTGKIGNDKVKWRGVVWFSLWIAFVGWCHHFLITAIWATI